MPAHLVHSPPSPADAPSPRIGDPACTALQLVAGSFVFLGAESTASVRSIHLAPRA
ncbi:hypothetical protein QWJ90_07660 [Microbacterium oryzae]|uniref:hypothetical protein n=1 Tax=Microbacterium oryzae TaxID=743009 RepID=UPI0025B11DFA|nr:hypothetical protein [Microbacterium oryzae]MDN3310801.1 hypothetical protein [Microbacterium oryzae]